VSGQTEDFAQLTLQPIPLHSSTVISGNTQPAAGPAELIPQREHEQKLISGPALLSVHGGEFRRLAKFAAFGKSKRLCIHFGSQNITVPENCTLQSGSATPYNNDLRAGLAASCRQ